MYLLTEPSSNAANPPAANGASTTGAIPPSDPPAATPTETKAPETKTAPPPQTKAPTRQPVTQQKKQTTPVSTPVSTPVQQAPAPQPAAPAAAATGTLQLVLNPPGSIEIDGQEYGEKARFSIDLSGATHLLRVKKDGYTTITQTVEIKVGEKTTLRLTLEPKP